MTSTTPTPTEEEAVQMRAAIDAAYRALAAPFHPFDIEWRVGSITKDRKRGMALAYLNARAVMERLDEVLGCDGWTETYQGAEAVGVRNPRAETDGRRHRLAERGWICSLTIRLPDGTTRSHTDGADETDIEPVKGGLSDAFKRAAAKFGVGRYLYRLDTQWVDVRGRYLAADPELPSWALPGGSGFPPGGPERRSTPSAPPEAQPSQNQTQPPPAQPPLQALPAAAPPPAATGWDETRKQFVANTQAMTPSDPGHWRADGANRGIAPVPQSVNGAPMPWWGDAFGGNPNSQPIKDSRLTKPMHMITWAEFAQGDPDGARINRLIWEIEDHGPPEGSRGRAPKQQWIEDHNIRTSRAMHIVTWVMARAHQGQGATADDPDHGRDERGSDPGERVDDRYEVPPRSEYDPAEWGVPPGQ